MTLISQIQETLKVNYPTQNANSRSLRTLTQSTFKRFMEIDQSYKQDKLTVLSLGAGHDSTALLAELIFNDNMRRKIAPERFLVVMSDTGNEHDETYNYIPFLQKLCDTHDIEFYFITKEMGFHSPAWQSLVEFYERTRTCGSKVFKRSCTDNLKVKVIYRFLAWWLQQNYGLKKARKQGFYQFKRLFGKLNVLIGFAKGEEKRIKKREPIKWRAECINLQYPLINCLKWSRLDCQRIIRDEYGLELSLPTNCKFCPYSRPLELLWLKRFHPEDFSHWVRIERAKLDHFNGRKGTNHGVFPTPKNAKTSVTLEDIVTKAEEQNPNITDEQLMEYKMVHGHGVMSSF